MESEKVVPTKEIPAELKGISTGMGDLYKDAYETFHKGDLEGARRKFEAFLKQYPNTELSDNAQFWIGETYFLKKDYERAILEYEKAIVKYPEGDKISSAIFKQALAFLELGDKTNARNLLKRVIEKYPHSDQAEMAKKKLETIK
jgi:tol-pal system protein YbgF